MPAWLRRAAVDLFPRGTGVHTVKEIIDTMDHNSHAIYNSKKAALTKGDSEVVKQVSQGKDILSVLSTFRLSDLDIQRVQSTCSAGERCRGWCRQAVR